MSKSEGESRGHRHTFSKKICLITTAVILVLATSLGVGLGIGLSGGSGSNSSSPTPSSTPSLSPPSNTTGAFWQPPAGTSWQIVLQTPLSDTSLDVSVYDVDLFDNPASTFDLLHASSKRVICYFSAGSYEPNRPDSANFTDDDKGTELDGWPGEYWLDTTSLNVRSIMTARIALAARKGCDGIDPDNIDGYDNDNGLSLTTTTAISYLGFLSTTAHAYNLSVGLKNGGQIVNDTLSMVQWEVNEQCVQYHECNLFQPFIAAGKPVFHIEYPKAAPDVSVSAKDSDCGGENTNGFSTVLKEVDLGDWVELC